VQAADLLGETSQGLWIDPEGPLAQEGFAANFDQDALSRGVPRVPFDPRRPDSGGRASPWVSGPPVELAR
jgi:hypothetical protein